MNTPQNQTDADLDYLKITIQNISLQISIKFIQKSKFYAELFSLHHALAGKGHGSRIFGPKKLKKKTLKALSKTLDVGFAHCRKWRRILSKEIKLVETLCRYFEKTFLRKSQTSRQTLLSRKSL